jgi:hypothetical protein
VPMKAFVAASFAFVMFLSFGLFVPMQYSYR